MFLKRKPLQSQMLSYGDYQVAGLLLAGMYERSMSRKSLDLPSAFRGLFGLVLTKEERSQWGAASGTMLAFMFMTVPSVS